MAKKKGWRLTEGSKYKIISLGARDSVIETTGIFKGFANLGMEDVGLCMEVNKGRKKIMRIIPLQVVLAIDVLSEKEEEEKKSGEEVPGFYT